MEEKQEQISFRDLKTKKVWRRFLPQTVLAQGQLQTFFSGNEPPYNPGRNVFEIVTQADFLAEYYPTSHKINSETYYPNVWRTVSEKVIDPVTGEYSIDNDGNFITQENVYCEIVPRFSFPYQQIIAFTHIYHATSNDIQHELAIPDPTEAQDKLFDDMCSSWHEAGMEDAWYQSFKAREITGDTAFVGSVRNGEFSWRVFSYKDGDVLYPHYDQTGALKLLVRSTFQYDASGMTVSEVLEVWDEKNYSIYRRSQGESNVITKVFDRIKGIFGIEGYVLEYSEPHGFPFIPAVYMRNEDGPGWSASQDSIDNYELNFSQMAHNNQAYGEAILVTKTKGDMPVDITRGLNGTIKQIDMDSESEAHFLEGQSASDSYMKQLDKLEEMIYRGSEIIKSPTELKSGDTPATSIKLLFTPNMQRAESDLTECRPFISGMWRIFAFGYGYVNNCITDAMSLRVISWGKVFVPQSESSIVADLVALVNAKILSAQTAAERCPFYSKPGESKKIQVEEKRKRDAELLVELEEIKATQQSRLTQNSNIENQ
ncbi:MAG: phage portal protein [Bacteroidales bacterium]|nr:phage portal protein [Candidatus Scybalousia scybalohippi]